MVKGAWVTLATNDSYSLGALVLAHSLKQVGTQQELAILVTPGVTNSMRARLSEVFNSVKEVNILDSKDKANLKLLQRPELGITFTKLHCWQLTQYEKCVFLDADTLVLQNCDELFEREELSAAPDVGWPDCFNSGVFVYRPSEATYNSLIQFALDKGSFDGGDQGLLNLYFSDWPRKDISKHLPFIYNVCSTAFYSYLPAFKQFGKDVKIIHFIGNAKPWLQYFDTQTKKVRPSRDLGHLEPILQKWWNIFCSMIHPNLTPDMSGLAGAFAKLTLGQQRTPEQEALEDSLRRQNWEQGNIDYLGRDSFDNIWSKICETLARGSQENEGENSQIKPDDLVLPSPQQETCPTVKEDVVSASQEVPRSTDTQSAVKIQEKDTSVAIPLPSPVEKEPITSISVASSPEKIATPEVEAVAVKPILPEETPESKSVPIPTDNILTEKTSSSAEIAISKTVEPSTTEDMSKVIEQVPTEHVSTGEDTTSKTAEQIPSKNVTSPEDSCKSKPVEPSKTEIKSIVQGSSEIIDNVSVQKAPSESLPSTEETSKAEVPLTKPVTSEVMPPSEKELSSESPKVLSVEQVGSGEVPSSPSVPSKPKDSKQDIPAEKISEPQNIPPTEKTQVAPASIQQESLPAEQVSPEIAVCPQKSLPPIGETPSLKETVPQVPEKAPKMDTPTSQSIPSTEQSTVLEKTSCPLVKASAPTEASETEQISSEKISHPLEKSPSLTEKASPLGKVSPPTMEAAEPKTLASAPAEPISPLSPTVTSTSTVSSSEPPPPITAPPRKNGGKKQNKSKK